MALYVNTNVSSLNAQRKLTNSTNSLNVSYQRLASGLRINSAKDDAAGLLISNRLTSQINGLDQGNRNANDGIALAQTMEGALDETTTMLQRIRTLAVQAANGTYTDEDREALQQEVTQLCQEITRISEKTTYGGARILDGAEVTGGENSVLPDNLLGADGKLTFQVGANHDDTITLSLSCGFAMSGILTGSEISDLVPANEADATGDTTAQDNYQKAVNETGLISYDLNEGNGTAVMGLRWSVSTQDAAQATLENIDSFIQYVDAKRADLGAIQNRMESTIRNQSSISENESDARSRIRDTDFAAETAALTQNNIIQQASQSILAQANQRPQIALSLLSQ